MSGHSFLAIILMDLLLVNQVHLFKLPIFEKEEPNRVRFTFNPNLTNTGPAQPSSGTAHVQIPSALVNLSYEGDNYCSGKTLIANLRSESDLISTIQKLLGKKNCLLIKSHFSCSSTIGKLSK